MSGADRIRQKKAAKRAKKRKAALRPEVVVPSPEGPPMALVLGDDTEPHHLKLSTMLWNYAEQ